jgi:hypothetical protein
MEAQTRTGKQTPPFHSLGTPGALLWPWHLTAVCDAAGCVGRTVHSCLPVSALGIATAAAGADSCWGFSCLSFFPFLTGIESSALSWVSNGSGHVSLFGWLGGKLSVPPFPCWRVRIHTSMRVPAVELAGTECGAAACTGRVSVVVCCLFIYFLSGLFSPNFL